MNGLSARGLCLVFQRNDLQGKETGIKEER